MKVIHTMMVRCGSGIPTHYVAQIVNCRWTNKERGKWSGRALADTVYSFDIPVDVSLLSNDVSARCDAMSRMVAAELGLPAGPDVFPFAR